MVGCWRGRRLRPEGSDPSAMPEIDLNQIFAENMSNPFFGDVVREIVNFLNGATAKQVHGPSGNWQMSNDVSELYAFRKRIGYCKLGAFLGLNETIEALGCCSLLVQGSAIVFDHGLVALWLDDQHVLRGLFLAKKRQGWPGDPLPTARRGWGEAL